MKKCFLVLLISLSFLICISSLGLAQIIEYTATTNMPIMTAIDVTASKIWGNVLPTPDDDVWTSPNPDGMTLKMGALKKLSGTATDVEDPENPGVFRDLTWVVFLPEYYFALDVGFNGGIDPSKGVTVDMISETFPATATSGLGTRGNITYVKTELDPTNPYAWYQNDTVDTLLDPPKYRYMDDPTIMLSNVVGGWLRMYVGTANGNPNPPVDASGSELFTPSDPTGTYSAVLQITLG